MARRKRPTDKAIADFRGRMAFFEDIWGVTTEYEVDLSTGVAWVKVRMPGTSAVLSLKRIHIDDLLLPAS
jgi:hypothetical protein